MHLFGEAEAFKGSAHISNPDDRISPSSGFGACPKVGEERCLLPEVLQLELGQGGDDLVLPRLGESLSVWVWCLMKLLPLYLRGVKGDLNSNVLPRSSEEGKTHLSAMSEAWGVAGCCRKGFPSPSFEEGVPSGFDSPQQVSEW